MGNEIAQAWLLAAVVIAGLCLGSFALLLLGRLMGRHWIAPLDDELEPASRTFPLAALLWLPILLLPGLFYGWADTAGLELPSRALETWFDPGFHRARLLAYLLIWAGLLIVVLRRSEERPWSIAGLSLLLPTAGLAGIDWVLPLEPFWWTTLFGFAFAMSQLAPALALAFLANAVQREHVSRLHDRSLVSALMVLALAAIWIWFVHYLVAWMGNLPEAAGWYEARLSEGRWLPLALAAAMTAAAVLLLLQRHRGDWAVLGAASLLALQHPLHMGWLLRPQGTPALGLLDLLLLVLLGGAWIAAWWLLMRRHDRLIQARSLNPDASDRRSAPGPAARREAK